MEDESCVVELEDKVLQGRTELLKKENNFHGAEWTKESRRYFEKNKEQ